MAQSETQFMLGKSIQVPVWLIAATALVLLCVGGYAGSNAQTYNDDVTALRLALPRGTDSVGIEFTDLSASTAAALDMGNKPGVLVSQLQCGNLQYGDFITAINGRVITT